MESNRNPVENQCKLSLGDEYFNKLDIRSRLLRTEVSRNLAPTNPIIPSINLGCISRFNTIQDYFDYRSQGGYTYRTAGTETVDTAEAMLNELEAGVGSILYSGGMAAISSVFYAFLKAGDHVVCPAPMHIGTFNFVTKVLGKFGVRYTFVPQGSSVEDFEAEITDNTKIVYAETPSNPTLSIVDLEQFGKLKQKHPQILTAIDGTLGSPYLQQPLKYDIDFSIHSCSKYIGGHSDVIGGSVTAANVQHWKQLKWYQSLCASDTMNPFEAYLVIRSMKTLPLRMEQHSTNAFALAEMLDQHAAVVKCHYPGLKSHPAHEIAKRQMRYFGGMLGFDVGSAEKAKRVCENVKLFNLASSMGGLESLIWHPASMSHTKELFANMAAKSPIPPGFLRCSIGIESVDDLKTDLKQALDNA